MIKDLIQQKDNIAEAEIKDTSHIIKKTTIRGDLINKIKVLKATIKGNLTIKTQEIILAWKKKSHLAEGHLFQ